jgi:hypothetical protein
MLIAATLGMANAVVQVGPGGVRVGPESHHEYRDFGEDVEERRRVFD